MQIYWIETPTPGRLGVATRPRGGDWLAGDLAQARRQGVDILFSLLTDEEQVELDLQQEAHLAAAAGLEFRRLPVPDYSVPTPGPSTDQTLLDTAQAIHQGRALVAHCRQGIGRSPTLCAAFLVLLGADPDTAWAQLTQARGRPVPDTQAQRTWVQTLLPLRPKHPKP